MPLDRSAYEKIVKERAVEHLQDRVVSAALSLMHEAVPMTALTQSPEWDRYLQLISGEIEKARRNEELLTAKITNPGVVNHDQIMLLKLSLQAWRSRRESFEHALALPKQIIDGAKRAEERSHE